MQEMSVVHIKKIHIGAVILFLVLCKSIIGTDDQENPCRSLRTCKACIQYAEAECTWCESKDYTLRFNELDRCDLVANHQRQNCSKIANPPSQVDRTKDNKLTDTTKIKPQKVSVSLRPGQKQSFNISVRTPENYPVDVYLLMDLSFSMLGNLEAVETLGLDLGKELLNITSRFRVGFGTMVDKPVAPFFEINPNYWELKAQAISNRPVSPPWVLWNVLPLTNDTGKFEAIVKSANTSESIDGPDGWVDSLMQVAVCLKDVDWSPKNQARRLVVIATEAEFHIAGDGLLGGIVTQNDGQCKLDSSNVYYGTKMDYPSLSHMRKVLTDNSIVPIFAVSPEYIGMYEQVASYFGDEIGAQAGVLLNKSTNIVKLIRDTYEKIGQKQTIFHSADHPDDFEITYLAHCLNGTTEGGTCEGVKIGKTVKFTVSVKLKKCPEDGRGFSKLNISTTLGDVIPVEVSYLCDCGCTNTSTPNATECSMNGTFICGDCICNPGYIGEICDCPVRGKTVNEDKCRAPNSTALCSNKGDCVCGKCVCDKAKDKPEENRIDGKYCECSPSYCERDENGQICGGSARGTCDCDKCKCKPGWEGDACSCTNDTSACYNNGVLCFDRGVCKCGKCECQAKYTGKFCEICDGCEKGCSYFKDCVRCTIYQTGPLVGRCQESCNATITKVADVKSHEGKGVTCVENDEADDCLFTFVLNEGSDKVEIFAEEGKRCPREEGYLLIIIGVILGIVAIGAALLLIWKLLATIQDRREFAKFEREQQNARWDTSENPIFKQATTTFQNPTYGGKG